MCCLALPARARQQLFRDEGGRDACHLRQRPRLPRPWRSTTCLSGEMPYAALFIDGLDEKRAGSPDGRTAARRTFGASSDALGRPTVPSLVPRGGTGSASNDRVQSGKPYRRSAQGQGPPPRSLYPMTGHPPVELIGRYPAIDRRCVTSSWTRRAQPRRIEHLLTNPKNLEMLARKR